MKPTEPYERKWRYKGKEFSVTEYPSTHHKTTCPLCGFDFLYKKEGKIHIYRRLKHSVTGWMSAITVKKYKGEEVCCKCAKYYKLLSKPFDGIREFLNSFPKKGDDAVWVE